MMVLTVVVAMCPSRMSLKVSMAIHVSQRC